MIPSELECDLSRMAEIRAGLRRRVWRRVAIAAALCVLLIAVSLLSAPAVALAGAPLLLLPYRDLRDDGVARSEYVALHRKWLHAGWVITQDGDHLEAEAFEHMRIAAE